MREPFLIPDSSSVGRIAVLLLPANLFLAASKVLGDKRLPAFTVNSYERAATSRTVERTCLWQFCMPAHHVTKIHCRTLRQLFHGNILATAAKFVNRIFVRIGYSPAESRIDASQGKSRYRRVYYARETLKWSGKSFLQRKGQTSAR